ncbi:carbohydrate ABC transporter permease [uncultured Cocleimonas sp.]|uniref:carbohydrate ABC transporter permease n=1 Tax=uncultured Cocleimonas sp. TaxID=1051587 RepID=UPI002616075D|nr:sugar ABC transporter permease [uncultured Cocleimonas sp.]
MANSKPKNQNKVGWLMALPASGLIFLFLIVPFLLAFWFSFTNQRLISPNPTEFVGWSNFSSLIGVGTLTVEPEKDAEGKTVIKPNGDIQYPRMRKFTRNNPDYEHLKGMREWFSFPLSNDRKWVVLARDKLFMKALVNTILFVLIVAPLQGAFALLLALMINQKLPGINIFRTIYFMPVVISIVVVSILWRFIYDGENGLLNAMLSFFSFGLFEPVDWLGNSSTALGSIMVMSIWQGVGFHMIIWLSGLQTISGSLYEAAALEGATRWQTFRYVTWPGLKNTAVLIMVVITMQAFALFAQVDVMTRGGPVDSTQTLVFQSVQRGYEKQDIAGGSAIAVVLFLIVLSISLIQRFLTRDRT